MENQTFDLRNIRRYLDFPLKIETIGFRPKNNWVHRHNRITQYFLCFILKREMMPETGRLLLKKVNTTSWWPSAGMGP